MTTDTAGAPAGPGTPGTPWSPTAVHERAVVGAFFSCLLAVVFHRPDVAVLACPLVVIAVWGVLCRPRGIPSTEVAGRVGDLMEGQTVGVRLETIGAWGIDTVGHLPAPAPGTLLSPHAQVNTVDGHRRTTSYTLRAVHWGPAPLDLGELHARSAWGAYDSQWRPSYPLPLTVCPSPGVFDANGPVPHPSTLLGVHGSRRRGSGSEFDDIREFRPGDLPRHVHWPISARTGRLHVRTTLAENDIEVLLLVDAFGDLPGDPDGSLTRSVRAAASVAGWCTRNGDRVGLRVVGAGVPPIVSGSGHRQLLRIVGALARIVPASDRFTDEIRLRASLPPGGLLVVLSPLTERGVVDVAVERARAGVDVIVVDTCPEAVHLDDPTDRLSWRIVELERDRTTAALRRQGVAVVPWRGPGTLDGVLTQLAGRRSAR